jgi:hypothetical protein
MSRARFYRQALAGNSKSATPPDVHAAPSLQKGNGGPRMLALCGSTCAEDACRAKQPEGTACAAAARMIVFFGAGGVQ